MVKVVVVRCTKCSGSIFFVRERNADTAWLFENLHALNHRLFTRHEAATCPACAKAIAPFAFPEGTEDDHWDAMEKRGFTVTRDEPFLPMSDRPT